MGKYPKLEVKNSVLKGEYHLLTSDYKTRNKKRPTHSGMDLIAKGNTCDYIIAIEDGKVITSTYSITGGYYVEIEHENGVISRYLHMKKNSVTVKKGDKVSKGQTIGYMGNTGASNGAHLHFGIKIEKANVDPLPYLQGTLLLKKEVKKETNEVKIVVNEEKNTNLGENISYKVQKGDNLTKICRKYYGKYTKALGTKIVNANKAKYKKITLDYIQAGWTLVIPK